MNVKGWKIATWVSWGILIALTSIALILYVPQKVNYVKDIEKIDNLTWQYQIVSLQYEQTEVEMELFRDKMVACEEQLQRFSELGRYSERYTPEELAKRRQEELQVEEWLMLNIRLSEVRLESIKGMYERIYKELVALGVPESTLDIMEGDMNKRIKTSARYIKHGIGFPGNEWKKSTLYKMDEMWVTMDKDGTYCVFLDKPHLSKEGHWTSETTWWGVLYEKWAPGIGINECWHYKLVGNE